MLGKSTDDFRIDLGPSIEEKIAMEERKLKPQSAKIGDEGKTPRGPRGGEAEPPSASQGQSSGSPGTRTPRKLGPGEYDIEIDWDLHKRRATGDKGMGPIRARKDADGPGWWGERIEQKHRPNADAYERKVNPNNESYYVDHPNGRKVQFENLEGEHLVDAKHVDRKPSAYTPRDMPYAKDSLRQEAQDQVRAAKYNGKKVKWKVSDSDAADQLKEFFATDPEMTRFFREEGMSIDVEHFP
jgi:hypothetical protein